MNNRFKRTAKKCIAGMLTAALAGGVFNYAGSVKSQAQENATLPGIESIVSRYMSGSDSYNILEVVPDKESAAIGFLIGGQEPVYNGKKLSEMPSEAEREQRMNALDISEYNLGKAVTKSEYSEAGEGRKSFVLKGRFVEDAEGEYKYHYVSTSYRMLKEGEASSVQRYERKTAFSAASPDSTGNRVNVSFCPIPTDGTDYLELIINAGDSEERSKAVSLYNVSAVKALSEIGAGDSEGFAGKAVYTRSAAGGYDYYGYIAKGEAIGITGGYATVSGGDIVDVPDNDLADVSGNGVSDNDLDNASDSDVLNDITISKADSLYIVRADGSEPEVWMYHYEAAGSVYYGVSDKLNDTNSMYAVEFVTADHGDYYISSAVYSETGFFIMEDSYIPNDSGMYVMDGESFLNVVWAGEMSYEEFNAYPGAACRFISGDGQTGEGAVELEIRYNGGFDNAEWFKTNVLDLSESESDKLDVEVTTLTLAELCDLVENPSKSEEYGISLDEVNFVYLSGRGDYSGILSDPAVVSGLSDTILELARMAYGVNGSEVDRNSRIPFAVDYDFGFNTNPDLRAFVLYLMQAENENIATDELVGFTGGGNITSADMAEAVSHKVDSLVAERLGGGSKTLADVGEFLAGNVYLCGKGLVSSAFNTPKDDGSLELLYADVAETAAYENFLRQQNNVSGNVDESITDATIARYTINWTSKRVTVKSSLNVLDVEPGGSYDEDIVLQTKIINYINQADYEKSNITINHMASAEFIGKIEDLNELYDMIYFGDNLEQFNTVIEKDGDNNDIDVPVYNDANMKGLVYSHTGDLFSYYYTDESEENISRLINDSLTYENTTIYYPDPDNNPYWYYDRALYQYRAPGNDINSTRLEELKDFIRSGYVAVFADRYFKDADGEVSVDTYSVDSNSYFYQLMNFALEKDTEGNYLYWNKNVFTESRLHDSSLAEDVSPEAESERAKQQARQENFKKYLNVSKLSVRWEEIGGEAARPAEYEYTIDSYETSGGNVTKINSSAKMQESDELTYVFSLHSDSAVSADGVTYDCKLFIDSNADGRFSGADVTDSSSESHNSEELDNLNVYVYEQNAWSRIEKTSGRYQLSIDKTYKVTRSLPDGYVGALPWKLVFYNNNNAGIRVSESGYTAIKRDTVENIKILQLISEDDNNWNLTTDTSDARYDPEVTALLDEVERIVGFRVEIDSMTVSEITTQIRTQSDQWGNTWLDSWSENAGYETEWRNNARAILNQYDMIIVGFADNFEFGASDANSWEHTQQKANMAVAEAVKDYIDSGKSVLFTHDTTTYVESTEGQGNSWYWGYEFNKVLRASVGLDRFGVTRLYYQNQLDKTSDETLRAYYQKTLNTLNSYDYDTVYEPNTDTELNRKEGLTKLTTVRYMANHLKQLIETKGTNPALSSDSGSFYFPVNNSLLYEASYKNTASDQKIARALYGLYEYSGSSQLKVSQVNGGQITSYPYNIPDNMTVASTHYQWLQPNMELDKDNDGKSDIVVWYCLSDLATSASNRKVQNDGSSANIYNLVKNDVVNNYYIYTMGNVTYSGVGHSAPRKLLDGSGNPTYEKRLFINTMIAAYKPGMKAPSLEYKDSSGNKTDGVYVMFDSQNGMVLDTAGGQNCFSVCFAASDNNIISGKDIRVEFFKAAPEDAADAISVSGISGKVVPITNNVSVKRLSDKEAVSPNIVAKGTYSDDINNYFAGSVYYSVQNGEDYILSFSADELGFFTTTDGRLSIGNNANGSLIYARVTTVYNNGADMTEGSVRQLMTYPAELFELR